MAESRGLQIMKLIGFGVAVLILFLFLCLTVSRGFEKKLEEPTLFYVYIAMIAITVLLIYGIRKDNPKLMMPWLICHALTVLSIPFVDVNERFKSSEHNFGSTGVKIIGLGINILFFCILGSLYLKILAYRTRDAGNV